MNSLLILPYYHQLSPLPGLLKMFDINLVFKNNDTLKKLLIRNSPKNVCGCLYEIPCNHCDKKYIGQSGKELTTRIKQHRYNVRVGNMSSSLFVHMNDCNHTINWTNSKEIIYCKDLVNRNIIESCIIRKHFDNLINTSPGLYKFDELFINNLLSSLNIM